MVTTVFYLSDYEFYPGGNGNLPQSKMAAWVNDAKSLGAERIIMIDITKFKIGNYYQPTDESIIFERYESLEECMDKYEGCNFVFLDINENALDLKEFTHPEDPFYVVGPDFLKITTEREPLNWLEIPMLHSTPLYSHTAMMVALYDRLIKL